jgi:hypothetical protein
MDKFYKDMYHYQFIKHWELTIVREYDKDILYNGELYWIKVWEMRTKIGHQKSVGGHTNNWISRNQWEDS